MLPVGDVFGEYQNPSYIPAGCLPRTNFPANPRSKTALTIPTVILGSQCLSFKSTAMYLFPALGNVGKHFVMRASQHLRSIHGVVCTPAVAHLQIAHLAVEHRHSRRHGFDEDFQQFLL